MTEQKDINILRQLAEEYREITANPVFDQRRKLWAERNSLKAGPPLVYIQNFGGWSTWINDLFGGESLECEDSLYREHEFRLRILIWQHSFGDDRILEPWITQRAALVCPQNGLFGLEAERLNSDVHEGSFKEVFPIQDWSELDRLNAPHHGVCEEKTARLYEKIKDAVGELIEVDIDRTPLLYAHSASISDPLGHLRGIENLMYDMYDSPDELHRLLAFLRDATLANNREAEAAGDWGLSSHFTQAEHYTKELEAPRANARGRKMKDLFAYCQAQEFTMFSPDQHDEFMLQYQIPIMEQFGLISYGCCEDLTEKIDLLRKIKNLRMIAVAPSANVARCAEQIGPDYVISYRPNPANMVCCGFDEAKIRQIIREDLRALKANDCRAHINLKDVETVEGDLSRLPRWVEIVRDEIDQIW